MATEETNSIIVELHDLPITGRKDDRCGRVVATKSLKIDDIVAIAVNRRTDLNAVTLKSSFEILRDIASEQVASGASVEFGLGYYGLGVTGVFIGDNAQWDSTRHSLHVKTVPTRALRNLVRKVSVNVRGMASTGTFINSVTDVASGKENSILTPGGAVNVSGTKIKVIGDNGANGIHLTNQADGSVTTIPANSIAVNASSKITFIVPLTLPGGNYKLGITTQFSNQRVPLKEPRTYVLDYLLSV
ncbi:MAG: DUF4469 domain-containing protein [Breznakibacter sp.]